MLPAVRDPWTDLSSCTVIRGENENERNDNTDHYVLEQLLGREPFSLFVASECDLSADL